MDSMNSSPPDEARLSPERVENMIDLNLLPQRYRRSWPRPSTVLAWLLMLALLGSLYFSYQAFEAANRHYAEQRADLASARDELEASDPISQQIAQLRAEIEAERQQVQDLQQAAAALDIQEIAWGSTLEGVLEAAPAGLAVDRVSEEGGEVTLSGTAMEYHLPLNYAAALRELSPSAIVTVEGISLAAAAEAAEATPTPTATPDDEGEETQPDEAEPAYMYSIRLDYPALSSAALTGNAGGAQ